MLKIALQSSYTGIMNLKSLAGYAISGVRFVFRTTNCLRNGQSAFCTMSSLKFCFLVWLIPQNEANKQLFAVIR